MIKSFANSIFVCIFALLLIVQTFKTKIKMKMKKEICIIKRTHSDNRIGCVLEIGGNISIPLETEKAKEVIRNAGLQLHESYKENNTHGEPVNVELHY